MDKEVSLDVMFMILKLSSGLILNLFIPAVIKLVSQCSKASYMRSGVAIHGLV